MRAGVRAGRCLRETVAAVLLPVMAAGTLPVYAGESHDDTSAAASADFGVGDIAPPAAAPAPAVPPPPPPPPTRVNRTLPKVTPVPQEPAFSASPSVDEIFRARVFSEPLVPLGGAAPSSENVLLAQALTAYVRGRNVETTAPIEAFLEAHPHSAWRASLLTNLGVVYRRVAGYTRAIDAQREAWELARADSDDYGRAVADKALGELLELHMMFGHQDELERVLGEIEGRDVRGAASGIVDSARWSVEILEHHHHEALPSGPIALGELLQQLGRGGYGHARLKQFHATPEGASLAQMRDLGAQVGLELRMVKRAAPATAVLIPSVVHLRTRHFSAVVEKRGERYRLSDPLLGGEVWVSPRVLEEESSGYFLIPVRARVSSAEWADVDEAEARHVRGKCAAPGVPPERVQGCQASSGGGRPGDCPSGSCGLATYSFHRLTAGLQLQDTPLWYAPALGPAVALQVSYQQREVQPQIFSFTNLGRRWTLDWVSYVEDTPSDPNATVRVAVGGGGFQYHEGMGSGTSAPDVESRAVLVRTSSAPIRYERRLPDGSVQVFAQADGAMTAPRRVFMTEQRDAQGNAVQLTYDAQLRLVALSDALGQVTTLSYEMDGDPYKLTAVSDPFGRVARFEYDAAGRLSKITDVIGLESRFEYGTSEFVTGLTTPYGTTTFRWKQQVELLGLVNSRWIEATDPLGGTERVEYVYTTDAIAPSEQVPAGFSGNGQLHYRNSFYWDKRAWALGPGDYTKAHVTHWLWSKWLTISSIPGSEKAALEGRVWYEHAGAALVEGVGPDGRPAKIGRVLDDGTSRISRYEYNSKGKVTRATDPVGRVTVYEYAANEIDLLAVKQVNGAANDLLTSFTYRPSDPPHLPGTVTDTAGQTTTYTYDGRGRLMTVETPPRNGPNGTPLSQAERTTTYAYYADTAPLGAAHVETITGPTTPQGAPVTSFTYDEVGRVHTVSDEDGSTQTYDYDALDRITRVTYADGTYDETVYNRLDAERHRDRLGRRRHTFHDALRRVVATRDPLGRTVMQQWCTCGSLDKLIDAKGQATTWERDVQGRVTREIRADGKDKLFVYEARTSQLKEEHDFLTPRQVKSYAYFADGNLRQVSYANAQVATPTVSYTYDPVYNRVATMTDGIGLTTYAYHAVTTTPSLGAGQLASVDGPLANDTVSYSYDELGRIASRGLSTFSSTFKYDALGRLASQVSPAGSFTSSYDAATGRVLSLMYPNGQTTTYSYFSAKEEHRLKQIWHRDPGAGPLSLFEYTYDAVGNIVTWTQQYGTEGATKYELDYDAADQLRSATQKTTSAPATTLKRYAYAYDDAGNRTSEQIGNVATAASHDSRNRLLETKPGGTVLFRGALTEPATVKVTAQGRPAKVTLLPGNRFEAEVETSEGTNTIVVQATDANGNTRTNTYEMAQTGATTTYTHDANGNLTSDGTKTYEWDAENRLVAVKQGGATLASFVYDGLGRRQEKTAAGVTRTYVYDEVSIIEERASTGQTKRYVEGPGIDQHLAMQEGTTTTYYAADHLGSIVQATNAAGAITLTKKYDAWGNHLEGSTTAGWAYTGREWDPETGLYYYRARYYNAKLGRFASEDPIDFWGGANFYAYVGSNPARDVDPDGLFPRNPRTSDFVHCLNDPVACARKYMCMKRAEKMTLRVHGHDTDGTRANAFKHCFWSCCISKAVGATRANAATGAHEMIPNNPLCHMKMDTHNNAQGAGAGEMYPGTGCRTLCQRIPLQGCAVGSCTGGGAGSGAPSGPGSTSGHGPASGPGPATQ